MRAFGVALFLAAGPFFLAGGLAGADSYVGPDATPAEVELLAACTSSRSYQDWDTREGRVRVLCGPIQSARRMAQCLAREEGVWDVFVSYDLVPRLMALAAARDAREVLDVNGMTGLAAEVASWRETDWPHARCRIEAFAAEASDETDTFGTDRVAQFECYVEARIAQAMRAARWIDVFEREAAR